MSESITMDTVTVVAIAVLATVFVGSLLTLIIVCQRKYCNKLDVTSRQHHGPDVNLVSNMEGAAIYNPTGVELDDVTPNLENILSNQDWINDATGLAPHTLEILKTCHLLTEKLVCMTMGTAQQIRSPDSLNELITIAKHIGPRVDDVVRAMYPPLDPRLLEARCSSLVLQVYHLVLVVKNMCRLAGVLDWINQLLADVEHHLKVLRDAGNAYETSLQSHITDVQQADNYGNLPTSTNQNGPSPLSSPQHNESSQV